MSPQYGELVAEIGLAIWAPLKFQQVSHLVSITARESINGCQPNFAALNRGCHPYSARRPSRWASAHILVCSYCVGFSYFSLLCQEIGWKERLQNDLLCVKWDLKP